MDIRRQSEPSLLDVQIGVFDLTRPGFAGGMIALLGRRVSLYAQAGYQFALDNVFIRNGIQGDIGLRFVW